MKFFVSPRRKPLQRFSLLQFHVKNYCYALVKDFSIFLLYVFKPAIKTIFDSVGCELHHAVASLFQDFFTKSDSEDKFWCESKEFFRKAAEDHFKQTTS